MYTVYSICMYTIYIYIYIYVYCILCMYNCIILCMYTVYVFPAPPHSTPPGTVPCTTCLRCHGTGQWRWTTMRPRPSATGRERSTGCQRKQSTPGWDVTRWVDVHMEADCELVLRCTASVLCVCVHCSLCPVMPSVTPPPSALTSLQTSTSSTDHPMWVLGCHVLF